MNAISPVDVEAVRGWDCVRIRIASPGEAELHLMSGGIVVSDLVIARLPVEGDVSRATIEASPHWRFMLDCLAEVNARQGLAASVAVETGVETWEHQYVRAD